MAGKIYAVIEVDGDPDMGLDDWACYIAAGLSDHVKRVGTYSSTGAMLADRDEKLGVFAHDSDTEE